MTFLVLSFLVSSKARVTQWFWLIFSIIIWWSIWFTKGYFWKLEKFWHVISFYRYILWLLYLHRRFSLLSLLRLGRIDMSLFWRIIDAFIFKFAFFFQEITINWMVIVAVFSEFRILSYSSNLMLHFSFQSEF